MKNDSRRPLPAGFKLNIITGDGNRHATVIERESGRGGSCIVYTGRMESATGDSSFCNTVIIKELYPLLPGVTRGPEKSEPYLTISDEEREAFEAYKKIFTEGRKNQSAYYEYFKDHTLPRIIIFGEANNTLYAVSDPGKGRLLSDINREKLSLNRIAGIMESVCKALRGFHIKDRLYLDCKPDNFFYYAGRDDLSANVYILDFDTVAKISDIRSGAVATCPCSPGWSPPEQMPSDIDGRYEDPSLIGIHTDIYSAGALFFWLLTGRKPEEKDIKAIQNDTFDIEKESSICAESDDEANRLATDILKQTLEPDPVKRKKSFGSYLATKESEKQFSLLYGLTAGDNPHYRPIHGKLEELHNSLEESKEKQDELLKKNENNHFKDFFFGTKKRIALTVCILAAAASAAGIITAVTLNTARGVKNIQQQMASEESILDDHVIFELENADHDYKTGLENWRRLDYKRAERDISAAYERASGVSPDSGGDMARINNSLGCLYIDMGKYEAAYDHVNDAYVTFKELFGEDSPEALAALLSIAQYDHCTGNTETALKTLQRITDTPGAGENRALSVAVKSFQAKIYEELGDTETAMRLYEELLESYDDIYRDGKLTGEFAKLTTDTALSQSDRDDSAAVLGMLLENMADLGRVYAKSEKYTEADALLKNGIEIAEDSIYIGRKNLITSKLYTALAKCCYMRGYTKDGMDAIDLAMRIQKNLFDHEAVYPGLVEVYDIYGDLLFKRQSYSEAYRYYQDAVNLAEEAYGKNHPVTAEAYYNLGKYYAELGIAELAGEPLETAIEIRRNILGYDSESTICYLEALAGVHMLSGDTDAAKECSAEADAIKSRLEKMIRL